MKDVAIVTGATRGIGLSIARELEKDYQVISIGKKKRENPSNIPGEFIQCDISDERNVKNAIEYVIEKYGRIDVLVNSAGVMIYNELTEATEEEFEKSFSVNVKGTFFMIKHVLPYMRAKKHGYIINISSVRGITSAPKKGIYSATKFAVRSLTETTYLENREFNIKATAICPGIVWTESTKEKLIKEGLSKEDVVWEEDITNTVRFLLSLSPMAHIKEIVIGGRLYG